MLHTRLRLIWRAAQALPSKIQSLWRGLLQSDQSLDVILDEFMRQRFERCRMIVRNSELLGEWEKNPGSLNDKTVKS
jgi:hypothetical protein